MTYGLSSGTEIGDLEWRNDFPHALSLQKLSFLFLKVKVWLSYTSSM